MSSKWMIGLGAILWVGSMGCGQDEPGGSEDAEQTGAVAQGVAHPLPGDPEAGADVYGRVCAACHGQDGKGNGGLTGADFVNDETRLAKSNEQLLASIRDGVDANPPMPPQGSILSEQEMKDALSYIRQEFGSK